MGKKEELTIKDRVFDEKNIYSAIFCLESYVFDKGLLDTDKPVVIKDDNSNVKEVIAKNDLELYYALSDKYNVVLIEKVIKLCTKRLRCLFADKNELFTIKVYFKLKSYDGEELKFRPMHTARLTDLICMVSILIPLMYDDNYTTGKRSLSDLSKLLPHNFYGNIPSTNVQYLFHKWQTKYKEYTDNVIEHCRMYQNTHNYMTEVSLDIKSFFPSISPMLLYNYIVDKLSLTYEDDLNFLQMAITKLLFFNMEKDNVGPWREKYYPDECNAIDDGLYMNCGIPQGLPQSYFFGNLCMIEIKNILMKEECFKGDAYFYVDDSVIYIQSALKEAEFNKRIKALNEKVAEWCRNSEGQKRDIDKYVSANHLDFHNKINYKIVFHENGKSVFTPIDKADTRYGSIGNLAREVSMSSNLTWNIDEIDDQVSLGKLIALDEIIANEIKELKKQENKDDKKEEFVSSRLKNLRRFKKFFLYRNRLLKIKDKGGPDDEMIDDFKKRQLSEDKSIEDWFEQNDEDIFQSEYRLIIQKVSKDKAENLCNDVQRFEKSILEKNRINDEQKNTSLYFSKDVRTAVLMKSLTYESYAYLVRWAKENFSGLKELNHDAQMNKCREFLAKKSDVNIYKMIDEGFERKSFTRFVMMASTEYKRRILNVFYSEIIGVSPSDALTFTKLNSRKLHYTELRIMSRLRNKNFDLEQFESFVNNIDDRDVSNRMVIDLGLLDVLNRFILQVKRPEWVDDLIITHRLVKGLWYNGSKFLNSYTLHNEEHAVTLINKSLELINRIDYFAIKDVDYYILFLACYLHDISMVIHPDLGLINSAKGKNEELISDLMVEMKKTVTAFFKLDNEDLTDSKVKSAGKFIVNVFNKVYEYFENEVRTNHAYDSAKFILEHSNTLLSYLEPTLLSFVAAVSESHGSDVLNVYGVKSRAKKDTVSLKYLMMLIRLADLMDVANDRVNYHLLRQNLTHLSQTSKFHWISHLVTDRMDLRTTYNVPKKENGELDKKRITETINFDLHLNFQQLTTVKNTKKCKCCKCVLEDHCIKINILNSMKPYPTCCENSCTILCLWMTKKHEWLIQELIALNEYLFSVDNSMFKTRIRLNIHYRNDMKLDPDMFDSVQEYLGI